MSERNFETWYYMGVTELQSNKEGSGWLLPGNVTAYFKNKKGSFMRIIGAPYTVEVERIGERTIMHGMPLIAEGAKHELAAQWVADERAYLVNKSRKYLVRKAGVDNAYNHACKRLGKLYKEMPPSLRSALLADIIHKITAYR